MLRLRPGLPASRTHDYIRHGTTMLFAALEGSHRCWYAAGVNEGGRTSRDRGPEIATVRVASFGSRLLRKCAIWSKSTEQMRCGHRQGPRVAWIQL
jgi:hypothetical protein